MTKYNAALLIAFALVWIWAAVNPAYPDDWLLENYLVFLFVPFIIGIGVYFRLSSLSYTLITLFMILHVIGAHYTYAEVPFGSKLQAMLGASRNMYDRLVHFSFGFLLAYPMREVFVRITGARGFWGLFLPLDATLSLSAVYEIIEWSAAANVNSTAGLAFLGAQGDIWDAQKDMTMAGCGAALAMLIIAAINMKYNPEFGREFLASFKIGVGDAPLGERQLRSWRNASKH